MNPTNTTKKAKTRRRKTIPQKKKSTTKQVAFTRLSDL